MSKQRATVDLSPGAVNRVINPPLVEPPTQSRYPASILAAFKHVWPRTKIECRWSYLEGRFLVESKRKLTADQEMFLRAYELAWLASKGSFA